MKLVHANIEAQFKFNEYCCLEWIIESPMAYRNVIHELQQQVEGLDGNFVLSLDGQTLPIHKSVELVTYPLLLNLNNKTLLTKLYNSLRELAYDEQHYLNTQEFLSSVKQYVYLLEQDFEYDLAINEDIELTQLFKAVSIQVECSDQSLAEQILHYIDLCTNLLGRKMIVFVNLRSFLCDEEINSIINNSKYKSFHFLLLENQQRDKLKESKQLILDKDLCEIF